MHTVFYFLRYVLFIIVLVSIGANIPVYYILKDSSKIKVTGTTNVAPYSCALIEIEKNQTLNIVKEGNYYRFGGQPLKLKVLKFECDNQVMTNDFRELLKYKSYPDILLKIIYIEMKEEGQGSGIIELFIAGTNKRKTVEVKVIDSGQSYILKGKRKLDITEFGLEPPVKFFGMITVDKMIEIDFNLELTQK